MPKGEDASEAGDAERAGFSTVRLDAELASREPRPRRTDGQDQVEAAWGPRSARSTGWSWPTPRSPRDGRFIEAIGKYHPMEDPSLIEIDADRALHWLREGAQPTSQVRNLLKIQGVWDTFKSGRSSAKAPVKAKAAAAKGAAAKKSASKPAGTGAEQAGPPPRPRRPGAGRTLGGSA